MWCRLVSDRSLLYKTPSSWDWTGHYFIKHLTVVFNNVPLKTIVPLTLITSAIIEGKDKSFYLQWSPTFTFLGYIRLGWKWYVVPSSEWRILIISNAIILTLNWCCIIEYFAAQLIMYHSKLVCLPLSPTYNLVYYFSTRAGIFP